jgi:hypothetical protein
VDNDPAHGNMHHPLADGNERAAWVSLRLFVDINDWRLPLGAGCRVSLTSALLLSTRELRSSLMTKIVAGAVIAAGECGEDDITSANLEQMAATLETRPPTDDDRRELVEILRWLAKVVRDLEAPSSTFTPPATPIDDPPPE